ncbi:nickel pincer cofactor biosynthesis protein LarC [Tessaracoccus lapidicaptus]|uniref:nickel pincer cofactor biosynthesis protein LarC n=1 Tax=Tessaracoccus lapidicaptus TaxID=1427523 RepID=UPI00333FBEA9
MHDIGTAGHPHPHPHEQLRTADGVAVDPGTRVAPTTIRRDIVDADATLWIDAGQGASGDMLLAALIDAGADAGSVAAVLDLIAPGLLHLQTRRVQRGPFAALKVDVIADEPEPPTRHLADIEAMLDVAGMPAETLRLATSAFRSLAKAEAAVHGAEPESVHFHEVGALDSIGDIVGVAEAVRTLGIGRAASSPVAVGAGTIATQHGLLPVPPPAVAELSRGWQVEAGGPADVGELCTPTGMALIRALCDTVGPLPAMTVESVGVGAGSRPRADRPGVLRAVVGTAAGPRAASRPRSTDPTAPQEVCEVSANIDDLDPRVWPAVIDRLLDAGSVDAWLTPILMKRGRPAHTVSALVPPPYVDDVVEALVTHTSTIGVRVSPPWRRRVLHRTWRGVDVDGFTVRIKVSGDGPGSPIQQATAEFVDVEDLAAHLGCAQRVALTKAQGAAWRDGLYPGAPWPPETGDDDD